MASDSVVDASLTEGGLAASSGTAWPLSFAGSGGEGAHSADRHMALMRLVNV